MIEFEWNKRKASENERKHGVSFDEAKSVFYDEFATQFEDSGTEDEERFLLLGLSNLSRNLVVVHCERGKEGDLIRLISARKATKNERKSYEGDLP